MLAWFSFVFTCFLHPHESHVSYCYVLSIMTLVYCGELVIFVVLLLSLVDAIAFQTFLFWVAAQWRKLWSCWSVVDCCVLMMTFYKTWFSGRSIL